MCGGLCDESKVMVLLRMKEYIQKQLTSIHKSYYILRTKFLSFFFSKGACSMLKHFIFACALLLTIVILISL